LVRYFNRSPNSACAASSFTPTAPRRRGLPLLVWNPLREETPVLTWSEHHDRAAKGIASTIAAAKARSVIANVAAQRGELAAIGRAPIVATVAAGRKTASVNVAGKRLGRDFPLIARDDDQATNGRPLASAKAGSDYEAHWKCHRCGHEWVCAGVAANVPPDALRAMLHRTRRRQELAGRASSRAAVGVGHVANAPLRPDRIEATYDRTVSWLCRDDPTHPAYRMSPGTRVAMPVGCPICRKKRDRAGAKQQAPDKAA
jgi:hypothetical protein